MQHFRSNKRFFTNNIIHHISFSLFLIYYINVFNSHTKCKTLFVMLNHGFIDLFYSNEIHMIVLVKSLDIVMLTI